MTILTCTIMLASSQQWSTTQTITKRVMKKLKKPNSVKQHVCMKIKRYIRSSVLTVAGSSTNRNSKFE